MPESAPATPLSGHVVSWRRRTPQGPFLSMGAGVERLLGVPPGVFLAGGMPEPGLTCTLLGPPGPGEFWEHVRLLALRRADGTRLPVLEATRTGRDQVVEGQWLVLPESLLLGGLERLCKALEKAPEEGLTRTLQAAVEALGLCFAALVGRPRPTNSSRQTRILAHFGLSPSWATTLAETGAGLLLPTPLQLADCDPGFPAFPGPRCQSLAAVPLPDLPGTWLVAGAMEASRFCPGESALLALLGRLLGSLTREGALRRERSRLEQSLGELIQAGSSCEALIDRDGGVVAASPPLEKLLGVEEGTLLGTPAHHLLLRAPGALPGGIRSRALARHVARRGQGRVVVRLQGGGTLWVRLQIRRLSAGRWHASLRPLEETAPAQDLASTHLWSLGVWTTGLAREWTQLMAGALGGASMARKELPAGHPAALALGLVEERIWCAAHLAQQVQELALPDATDGPLDPAALADEAVHLAGLSLTEGIRVQIVGRLRPMAGSPSTFRLLIHSALLYVASSSRVAPLELTLQQGGPAPLRERWEPGPPPGKGLSLSVALRGLTMEGPERPLPERVSLGSLRSQGPGLASLVTYLAGRMGGAVSFSQDADNRKQVLVFLPDRPGPALQPEERAPAQLGARSETLLLVEGDETLLRAAQESLEEEGHRTLSARDGLEAVALFQRCHEEIVLVIIDLSLPRLGGVEALRQMRKTDSGLRALVTSSYGEAITRQALDGLGVEGYLRKPYGQAGLIRKVAECLAL